MYEKKILTYKFFAFCFLITDYKTIVNEIESKFKKYIMLPKYRKFSSELKILSRRGGCETGFDTG